MDSAVHHTPARKLHLDVLRILAIALVVFNHSPAYSFPSYAATPAFAYYGMLALDICCKVAVPLFFMISGALLLGRDESMSRLFSKRILRFLIVIVAYGVLQYGFFIWTTHGEMLWSWKLLIRAVYTGWPIAAKGFVGYPSAIWFLYAYLAMLLVLPFLRAMVRHLRDRDYLYLFALQIILVALLPLGMDTIYGASLSAGGGCSRCCSYIPFFGSCSYVIYMLLGYFLEHRLPCQFWQGRAKRWLVALAPVCILCSLIGVELVRLDGGLDAPRETDVQYYLSCFLLLPCAFLYCLVQRSCANIPMSGLLAKVITLAGGSVFTVMLTENIFRWSLMPAYHRMCSVAGDYGAALLLVLVTCLCAGALGSVLKRVPVVKKYL